MALAASDAAAKLLPREGAVLGTLTDMRTCKGRANCLKLKEIRKTCRTADAGSAF